jgi:general secretion pathway protein B
MSYILDALKKTEQERQRGTTPSLSSQQRKVPPQRPKRSVWLYLLLAVLLLNAGVLCWWLKPWQRGSANTRSVAQTEKKEQSASPASGATAISRGGISAKPSTSGVHPKAPVAMVPAFPRRGVVARGPEGMIREVTPERKIAEKANAPVPGQEVKLEPSATDDQLAKSEAAPRRRQMMPGQAGSSVSLVAAGSDVNGVSIRRNDENAPDSAPKRPGQAVRAAVETEGGQKPDNPAVEESQAVSGKQSAESSGVNEEVEVVGNVLLDYGQLPYSLRQQLPPLTISLHLYADKPERRMANIDGQMRHEKERIDKDLTIEEITSNGVIFNYRGRRFLKKVFH